MHKYIQQEQHSLLSQASWGRLEMKPKRNKGHGSGKLIASLQTLLSKATSLEIFHSSLVSLNRLVSSQFRSTSTSLYIIDPL